MYEASFETSAKLLPLIVFYHLIGVISVLKTCISVMKTTTDFSVVSETIVLKLGTLLDNMSG